ncbi:MAG: universal stress protein [Terrimicrobiaceae bacterium]
MRVLCCLDGTNAAQIAKATEMLAVAQPRAIAILHVIDTGPRRDMDRIRDRFFRSKARHLPHEEEMLETEKKSAQEILDAGRGYLADAETIEREGRPEREIVNVAAEWNADLVLICSRAVYGGKVAIGPRSVGHVARFVLDHAPCPVFLVRPLAREQFPISR